MIPPNADHVRPVIAAAVTARPSLLAPVKIALILIPAWSAPAVLITIMICAVTPGLKIALSAVMRMPMVLPTAKIRLVPENAAQPVLPVVKMLVIVMTLPAVVWINFVPATPAFINLAPLTIRPPAAIAAVVF